MRLATYTLLACLGLSTPSAAEELSCLATSIYFESRGESKTGQYAVGLVILNRVDSDNFPSTVCEVVYQGCQFSWVCDGKSTKIRNEKAFDTALVVAHNLLHTYVFDFTFGALYYHADYVTPYWSRKFTRITQIDSHIFYKED